MCPAHRFRRFHGGRGGEERKEEEGGRKKQEEGGGRRKEEGRRQQCSMENEYPTQGGLGKITQLGPQNDPTWVPKRPNLGFKMVDEDNDDDDDEMMMMRVMMKVMIRESYQN